MIKLSLQDIFKALPAARLHNEHLLPDFTAVLFEGCNNDSRSIQMGNLYIALKGERFDGHDFIRQAVNAGASACLCEQPSNAAILCIVVDDVRIATGLLAAHWRRCWQQPLVAITGSNGKTTTKEMLRCIFQQQGQTHATKGNLNNDIGVPLTLFELSENDEYAVIEMGANHPHEIAYLSQMARPHVALITQCAPAHLAGFNSIQGVAEAKGEIFSGLDQVGIAVINRDDAFADYWLGLNKNRTVLSFSLEHNEADIYASDIQLQALSTTFTLNTPVGHCVITLDLAGQHNIYNALAASACAIASDCPLSSIQAGLKAMQSVAGRLQVSSGWRNSTILNDSYNANPSSVNAALQVLGNCAAPRWLILGDMLELGEEAQRYHREAGKQAKAEGIECILTCGALSQAAVIAFGKGAIHFEQQTDLIAFLREKLPENAFILVKGSRSSRMERVVEALHSF